MTELRSLLQEKIQSGEKLLSIYLTAGFPDAEATLPLLQALAEGGADFIELGVPFSDPLADGPVIQAASTQALAAGMNVEKALQLCSRFTGEHELPVLLMGYANPFMKFGWQRLAEQAQQARVAGMIIPDLPPEESETVQETLRAAGISLVFLASPNTSEARIRLIDRLCDAFVYAVSVTGVTGARDSLPAQTTEFLQRLRSLTEHPVLVGFGVSSAATARSLVAHADGVIIGSSVIELIRTAPGLDAACERVHAFVREIKTAIS